MAAANDKVFEPDKAMACGHCRRCVIHDDPGGCTTAEEYMAQFMCAWFAMCDNPAEVVIQHPVLGFVPACYRCSNIVDQQS